MNNDMLIIGKGYIGQRLHEAVGGRISRKKIHSFKDAVQLVKRYKPKTLVNCVGYTGRRNVDDCEVDPDKTIQANTFVPILLAEACIRHNIKYIHISSGCIYHYDYKHSRPIPEEQIPEFFELYYSRTKIYAEHVLKALAQKYPVLILRIRLPLDTRPHPKNILTRLVKYKTVIDLPNSVTYLPDFFKAFKHLLKIQARGIYHIVNKGALRYPELMEVYAKHVPDFRFETIKYSAHKLKRTNLILSTKKLEDTHFKVRSTQEVLEECVTNYLNCS